MKKSNILIAILALPILLSGCERREMPHEWAAWEPQVSLDQNVAIAPKCYGWSYSIDKYVPPEGEVDFGCATAANLAHMVAEPKDLARGRGTAMSDGERNDLFIDNYRKGKVTKIIKGEKIIKTD